MIRLRALRRVAAVVAASSLVVVGVAATDSTAGTAEGRRVALGSGIGSKAALASPDCDPTTERIKMQHYGTAPCVKPWPEGAENGGSTAQGVTATTIKVVVLVGDREKDLASTNGGIRNYATGANGYETDAVLDHNAMYARFYETWGRKVEFTFIQASGIDEAAQRADAVTAINEKPFQVLCMACQVTGAGGGTIFSRAVANAGVPGNPTPPTPQETSRPLEEMIAEFAAKTLDGRRAKYAGDPELQSERRRIGVVYNSESTQGLDISYFEDTFTKYGGKLANVEFVPFTAPLDATETQSAAQQQAPTIIARLKTSGVTTIIPFTDPVTMIGAMTRAATEQDYFPEWIPVPLQDLDFFGRLYDQEQWAHAFGPVWFVPWIDEGTDPLLGQFQWYWGENQGTYAPGADSLLRSLYLGVMLAGPKLNAKTYDAGLDAYPPIGGAFSDMVASLEMSMQQPRSLAPMWATALGWWNPEVSGPAQVIGVSGQGKYMYLDGAQRHLPGKYPKGDLPFFDADASVASFETLPASDETPTYECTGCPSTGGSETPSRT